MDERTLRILTLARLSGLGNRKISSLVRAGGVDEVIEKPRSVAELLGEEALRCLLDGSARGAAERVLKEAALHW